MSAQHTPGPWNALPIETKYGIHYTPVVAKTLLAKVYSEAYGNHDESEANARLIAAAPDLLDALRSLHAAMACYDSTPEETLALQYARAAIDKATGGAA